MKVTTERLENNKVALTITVEQPQVKKAFEKAWRSIAAKVNIPGFRKGKAPRKLVENNVGIAAIKEEAFDIIAKETYPEALEQAELDPVSHPSVDIEKFEEAEDMVYKVTVTVKPEVELGQYKEIEVEKEKQEVTDADVEDALTKLRERKAEMVVVDDAKLEQGDFAVIDFAGFIDGQPFSGGEGKGYPLEIGSGSFIPGFEDQLLGAKAGEERTVKVNFPEDYFASELAGKEAEFKVTIHDVKRKKLPELTDEFIKENSSFDTIEAWKKDCRERLEKSAEASAQNSYENNIIKTAVDNANVDVPEIMVEDRVSEMLHDIAHNLQHRGLKFEDYLKYMGKTIEELRETYKENALADIKAELVMDAIAKKEELKVEAEELQKELEIMAAQYKQPIDDIKKALVKTGNITMVNLGILRRKAARMILGDKAKKEEKEENAE